MSEINGKSRREIARRALIIVSVTVAIVLLLLLLWLAVDLLLLIFAGILLAIVLRSLSDLVSRFTGLSGGWSLTFVTLLLILVIGGGAWVLAPRLSAQANDLADQLPRALAELQQRVEQYQWARRVLSEVPSPSEMIKGRSGVLTRATGIVSTTLGVVVNFAIVVSVGLYLAADPRLYVSGIMQLVPLARRRRVREVFDRIGTILRRWLIGRFILMLSNGALTWLGLSLLGVPLALTLGVIAGALNFIPNVGPIIAGVPAILIALLQSPQQALYVLALYVVLQSVDGYVFTPLVQQRTIALPPVLTITAQVLVGVLLGGLGVALATPLAAVTVVLVRMLYIEDVLGEKPPANAE